MHTTTISYIAWGVLAFALCAWGGVAWFANAALQEKASYAAAVENANQALVRQAADARLRALIQDSAPARARMDALMHVEILDAVNRIESVGPAAGVKLAVSDASPAGSIPGPGGTPFLHSVAFTIQAEGTFSAVMKTATLLEKLPLTTSIESIDIARTPLGTESAAESARSPWRLNIRMRLLTSAPISS